MNKKIEFKLPNTSSAVNCDEIGHCWHPSTAVGSSGCCRCGKYMYPTTTIYVIPATFTSAGGVLKS